VPIAKFENIYLRLSPILAALNRVKVGRSPDLFVVSDGSDQVSLLGSLRHMSVLVVSHERKIFRSDDFAHPETLGGKSLRPALEYGSNERQVSMVILKN
jgi:hypothetical protein